MAQAQHAVVVHQHFALELAHAATARIVDDAMHQVSAEGIGRIRAVYFDIEIENAPLRAGAKERMASTTAADVGFAAEFREPMWSAAWIERVVRGKSQLLGPAGVSDTEPGVRPASRPRVTRDLPSAWLLQAR